MLSNTRSDDTVNTFWSLAQAALPWSCSATGAALSSHVVGTHAQLITDTVPSTVLVMPMQVATQYELQLEEGKLAAVTLKSKCRQLESESLFSEVFDKYEAEISSLQVGTPHRQGNLLLCGL